MKSIFIACIVLLFFASCHSLVEEEFADRIMVPVLNGYLEAGKLIKVHVSYSASLSDSLPRYVENALVIIEAAANKSDTLKYTNSGWYVGVGMAQVGETYFCSVDIEGYPTVTAQTTIPDSTEIGHVHFTELVARGRDGEKISSFEFEITNNPLMNQYWHVRLISDGIMSYYDNERKDFVQYFGVESRSIYMLAGQDTTLLNEANPLTLFSNKLMKNNTYKVKFYINENQTRFYNDQTNYIELRAVDESYYKFIKQKDIYESASFTEIGNSPQKYPLYSNVTNGLGIFCSSSNTRRKLELFAAKP